MNKDLVFYLVSSAVAFGIGAFVFWGPSTSTRRKKVPIVGLKNLGFTCFLNALLQALASCPIFIEWLDIREDSESISQSLANILKVLSAESEVQSGSNEAYSPLEIISSLRRNGWTISPGEQDAHELFHHLILTIEEEAQKCRGNLYGCLSDALIPATLIPPNIVPSSASLPVASTSMISKNEKKMLSHGDIPPASNSVKINGNVGDNLDASDRGDVTLLSGNSRYDVNCNRKPSPFTGFLTSQTHCTKCGFKSVLRYDKFDSLSLHLPPVDSGRYRHTLIQLLDRFVKTEMVSGVSCDGCNKTTPPEGPVIKTTAFKSLSIGKLPRCLCIHIPRTLIHSNGEPYKRQDYVDFPEFLVMDPYTQNNIMKEFKLKKEELRSNKSDIGSVNANNEDSNNITSVNDKTADTLKIKKVNHLYRIKAVVVHRGALQGGHFVTYRRGPLKSHIRHRLNQTHQKSHGERRWYLTSDADVRDATLNEALQSPAYMLFYEKCAAADNPL